MGAHNVGTRRAQLLPESPPTHYGLRAHIAAGPGPNAIFQFRFDGETGRITPNDPPRVSPENPDGPRHFCFHPSRHIIYVSNEQGCSVTGYNLDPATGGLSPFQTLSTLPQGFSERNSCSQIQITPNGKYVYAPNRGHDSIAGFAVGDDGRLTALGQTPSRRCPGLWHRRTGSSTSIRRAGVGKTGGLRIDDPPARWKRIATYDVGEGPMWVLIVEV